MKIEEKIGKMNGKMDNFNKELESIKNTKKWNILELKYTVAKS